MRSRVLARTVSSAAIVSLLLTGVVTADRTPFKPAGAKTKSRPNVLIILTDDQRADMMNRGVVPNIRRLFESQGVYFPNGVVTTPLCCPSRASIFSGRYVHNHGIDDNTPRDEVWNPNLTVQKELQEAGYKTALVGKYFSNWKGDPLHFDRWAMHVRPAPNGRHYYDPNFNIGTDPGPGVVQPVEGHATSFVRSEAITVLEEFQDANDSKPWFMQISPLSPHKPWTPMPGHQSSRVPRWEKPVSFNEDLHDKPKYVRRAGNGKVGPKKIRKKMLRSMKGVNALVRDVYKWLAANDEAENTLAFFISDNGYMLGEHGLVARKQVPYREAIEVPFYMRWPARLWEEGGRRSFEDSRIAANIDIAPTIYDAVGLDRDKIGYRPDGQSLLSNEERKYILIESPHSDNFAPSWRGLWSERWSFVKYGTGEREYYDLEKDPFQLSNVFEDRNLKDKPTNLKWLRARLDEAVDCIGRPCP